jgi:hypothetical protein
VVDKPPKLSSVPVEHFSGTEFTSIGAAGLHNSRKSKNWRIFSDHVYLILTNSIFSLLLEAHLEKSLTSKNGFIFVNSPHSIINRIALPQYRPPTNLFSNFSNTFSQMQKYDTHEQFEFFHNLSTLQPGYGMCCGICCFQVSTDPGHEIQVEK